MFVALAYQDPVTEENYPFWPWPLRLVPDFGIRYGLTKVVNYQNEEEGLLFKHFAPLLGTIIFELIVFMIILVFVYENIYVATPIKDALTNLDPRRWICFRRHFPKLKRRVSIDNSRPDPYVELEKVRVQQILQENMEYEQPLVVSKVQKTFFDFPAVKGVDFIVDQGQCFGLLGMNGAGKTSIFKMMTLNSSITNGQISSFGLDSRQDKSRYQKQFGYCPEMSALLDFMTSYEILRYMAWIKGTPYALLDAEANQWLGRMDLVKYKNVPISDYSGGTKRKLNTALSMIGNPNVIYLDEPTTGVDPVSRRFMWSCIKDFQTKLKTIVLTSHSMDECEELCNRLAIMNKGQFKCIGFIQKIKELFGTGFTLLIKVAENADPKRVSQIKEDIKKMYDCNLRDDYAVN